MQNNFYILTRARTEITAKINEKQTASYLVYESAKNTRKKGNMPNKREFLYEFLSRICNRIKHFITSQLQSCDKV